VTDGKLVFCYVINQSCILSLALLQNKLQLFYTAFDQNGQPKTIHHTVIFNQQIFANNYFWMATSYVKFTFELAYNLF